MTKPSFLRHIFSRFLSLTLVFALMLSMTIITVPAEAVEAASRSGFVIVLDPGHDTTHARGVTKVSGITEQTTNYQIAVSLQKQLKAKGFTVYLTRGTSCPFSSGATTAECLKYRVKYAKSKGCDLFVSIHLDASGANDGVWRSANGASIYMSNYYKSSLTSLCQKISSNLYSTCGMYRRTPNGTVRTYSGLTYSNGVKADYYSVILNSTLSGFPSILIEHLCLDNKHDANKLKSLGVYSFASADCKAITDWYDSGAWKNITKGTVTTTGSTGSSSTTTSSSSSTTTSSSAGTAAYVNYSFLNLRKSASTSAAKIVKLSKNDPLTILSSSNGWYKVKAWHSGTTYTGYVCDDYVKKGTPSGLTGGTAAYVNYSTLNLRTSPSTKGTLVVKLSKNDTLKLYEAVNGWYRVQAVHSGKTYTGYVCDDYIKKGTPSGTTTTTTSTTKTGYVNYTYLNVRSGCGTSYAIVGRLYKNNVVTIRKTYTNWYYISYTKSGKTYYGYVKKSYITLK